MTSIDRSGTCPRRCFASAAADKARRPIGNGRSLTAVPQHVTVRDRSFSRREASTRCRVGAAFHWKVYRRCRATATQRNGPLTPSGTVVLLENRTLGLRNRETRFWVSSVNRKMAAEQDAARVTRAGFLRQEQRAADEARLAELTRRRQQRAAAGANAGVGGAAGGSSTAAGSAPFESAGRTHPPRQTAFEGARSMGPCRDIFKCAVFSRGSAVAAPAAF